MRCLRERFAAAGAGALHGAAGSVDGSPLGRHQAAAGVQAPNRDGLVTPRGGLSQVSRALQGVGHVSHDRKLQGRSGAGLVPVRLRSVLVHFCGFPGAGLQVLD